MSKINLLPWRAELRARQKKQFLASLGGSAAMGLLAAGLIFFYYGAHVAGQQERNAFLEDQIALGEKKIEEIKDLDAKKQRLVNRKEVIDALQADRSRVVRLFESLVKSTPDGVVLTLVKQNEAGLVIEGRAQSNTRVSAYMRNLEASGWMKNPELSVIEATATQPGFEAFPYEFKLSVALAKSDELPAAAVIEAAPVAPVDPTAGLAPALPAAASTTVPAVDVAVPNAGTAPAQPEDVAPPTTTARPTPIAPAAPSASVPASSTPSAAAPVEAAPETTTATTPSTKAGDKK